MNFNRLTGSLTLAAIVYIPLTLLLGWCFYRAVKKHPRVTFKKILMQSSLTGIVPAGIFAVSNYTHGFYMALLRDLFIMWGVLAAVYGMWATTRYNARNKE